MIYTHDSPWLPAGLCSNDTFSGKPSLISLFKSTHHSLCLSPAFWPSMSLLLPDIILHTHVICFGPVSPRLGYISGVLKLFLCVPWPHEQSGEDYRSHFRIRCYKCRRSNTAGPLYLLDWSNPQMGKPADTEGCLYVVLQRKPTILKYGYRNKEEPTSLWHWDICASLITHKIIL